MIEVEDLTKRYGSHTAIEGITFQAQPGEILGLLGPNGAGKTTTMRILTGFTPPTSGVARVAGYDVMAQSMEVRERVGYMPERVPVYPDMTVYGFVAFWARLRGVRHVKKRVNTVLEMFELSDRRNMLVRTLSKGLRQRLGLAQALVHEPEVVILDEPTIGIDPQQVIEVRESVRRLREQHTVLFSSHILSEVEQVCDRVVIIHQGRVVAQGTTEMLSQQMQPGQHLFIAVGGAPAEQVQHLLENIRGVELVQPRDAGFVITTGGDEDLRGPITSQVAAQGWTLLELRRVEVTLEDIFLDIVGRGR